MSQDLGKTDLEKEIELIFKDHDDRITIKSGSI